MSEASVHQTVRGHLATLRLAAAIVERCRSRSCMTPVFCIRIASGTS